MCVSQPNLYCLFLSFLPFRCKHDNEIRAKEHVEGRRPVSGMTSLTVLVFPFPLTCASVPNFASDGFWAVLISPANAVLPLRIPLWFMRLYVLWPTYSYPSITAEVLFGGTRLTVAIYLLSWVNSEHNLDYSLEYLANGASESLLGQQYLIPAVNDEQQLHQYGCSFFLA